MKVPSLLKLHPARERLFKLPQPSVRLADLVDRARELTAKEFNEIPNPVLPAAKGAKAPGAGASPTARLYALATDKGIGANLVKLTTSLRRAAMPDVSRLLLSIPGVLESILLRRFGTRANATNLRDITDDTEGLRQMVMVELDGPLETFATHLVNEYIEREGLRVKAGDPPYEAFVLAVREAVIPLEPGRAEKFLERTLNSINTEGTLRIYVDRFADNRGEIESRRFTSGVRSAMVHHLRTLGLLTDTNDFNGKFDAGEFDEYFAQAYQVAIQGSSSSGGMPPVNADPQDSDFNLDLFDAIDDRGIIRENILAASALAYFHVLGDTLGIFPVVNALLLRRARGRLDLPRGAAAQRLQQLKDWLRRTSVTTEDRQLLYRRVFSTGEGEVLPDTVVNEEYPSLLHTLMEKVVDYVQKEERVDSADRVSRAPIDEAVRNLQYNLSYFANDIAEDTLVIKEHFNLAMAILSEDDVIAALGVGRRGNVWGVLQRLVPEELHRNFSVNTLRTLGVETYKVLQYVAKFDATTPEDEFRSFLRSAEALIIAQSALGDLDSAGEDSGPSDSGEDSDGWEDSGIDEESEPSAARNGSDRF